MLTTNATDCSLHEEIIWRDWNDDLSEKIEIGDGPSWEILVENNHNSALKRHWFKQKYNNHLNETVSMMISH